MNRSVAELTDSEDQSPRLQYGPGGSQPTPTGSTINKRNPRRRRRKRKAAARAAEAEQQHDPDVHRLSEQVSSFRLNPNARPFVPPSARTDERPRNNLPCSICLEVPNEFPHLMPSSACTHTSNICASCLEQHISYAVLTQGSTTLTCPDSGCWESIEYADVVRVAKSNQPCLDRYEALLLRRMLENEQNFVWCKNPSCNWGQLHEGGDDAPIVICQECDARVCFTHDVPWHTDLTCEQYTAHRKELEDQNIASEDYIDKHAKTCPNTSCGRRIEKSEGCDHMTCRRPAGCGHEFCWLCLADYDPIRLDGNHRHEPTCTYYAAISPPATEVDDDEESLAD